MDRFDNLAYTGISNYFQSLQSLGYKDKKEINKLLFILFVEELIDSPLSVYITEEDYKIIENTLYCIFGTTCLIPYQQLINGTDLIQPWNTRIPRVSEDDVVRFSENELIRLINE